MLSQLSGRYVFMAVYVLIVVGADLTEQAEAQTRVITYFIHKNKDKKWERACYTVTLYNKVWPS